MLVYNCKEYVMNFYTFILIETAIMLAFGSYLIYKSYKNYKKVN